MLKKTLVLLACSAVALTLATPVFAQSTGKIDKIGGPVPEATTPSDTTKPDTTTKTSQPATTAAPPSSAPSTAAPSASTPGAAAQNATAPNTVTASGNGAVPAFVALTQFPQIQQIANASSLPQFLNTLYKICIGAAAALALIMIMYAGVEIMRSSGSVTTNEKAKSRIQNAVLGLVLVLAPTIVFGIINPSILDLNFGKNFGLLKSAPINQAAFNPTNAGGNGANPDRTANDTFTGADTYLWVDTNNFSGDTTRCTVGGGTLQYVCGILADGSGGHVVAASQQCGAGETRASVCRAPSGAPTTGGACLQYGAAGQVVPITTQDSTCSLGYRAIPNGCCVREVGAPATGVICCAPPHVPGNAAPIQMYQLSAYFTVHYKTTNRTCYVATSNQYATQAECTLQLGNFRGQARANSDSEKTTSSVTVVKSCEMTTGLNQIRPAVSGLQPC